MTMKQKTIIAISALALCPMAACAFADEKLNALIDAAQNNNVAEVTQLIKAGADVDVTDENGKTVLMWAAEHKAIDVARLRIDSGADINAKDTEGKTALSFATEYEAEEHNATDMIALLKAAGAKE